MSGQSINIILLINIIPIMSRWLMRLLFQWNIKLCYTRTVTAPEVENRIDVHFGFRELKILILHYIMFLYTEIIMKIWVLTYILFEVNLKQWFW